LFIIVSVFYSLTLAASLQHSDEMRVYVSEPAVCVDRNVSF